MPFFSRVKSGFKGIGAVFARERKLIKSGTNYYIAVTAVLSAVSYGMMFIFHIPIFAPPFDFLQLDFADLGVVMGALMFGPMTAVLIAFVKCALYLPFDFPKNFGIGVLSNFILCASFGVIVALISGTKRKNLFLVAGFICAIVLEAAIAMFSNYFIIARLFIFARGEAYSILLTPLYIFSYNLPFNFMKFSITSVISFALFKGVQRALPQTHCFKFIRAEEKAAAAAADVQAAPAPEPLPDGQNERH